MFIKKPLQSAEVSILNPIEQHRREDQLLESQLTINKAKTRQLKQLELGFRSLAVVLGFVHVWSSRHYLANADAMSYLDIAEAYVSGNWQTAINAYWSPLYSWLIAFVLSIFKPSSYWKFTVVHVTNFVMYLFALGCFGFLIRQIVLRHQRQRDELLTADLVTLPDWALLSLGYSLFIWSSVFLVTVPLESPDMMVAAFVYLATGLLFQIRRQPSNWLPFVVLGFALGLGYLAKSVMLMLTPIFLIAAMISVGHLRRALPRVGVALALFLVLAAPFVFAISKAKGRFTTGESGKLNYLWSINGVTNLHWQGEEPGSGTPKHPTRKIFDNPPAFEFREPIGGTYPVWYDPTYWYEGSSSHFDSREQVRVFVDGLKSYYELFQSWGLQYGLFVGVVALYVMGRKPRQLFFDLIQQWAFIIPALAGLGLYALVNVQGRYVASFIVLLWLALFSAVRIRNTPNAYRFISSIILVLVVGVVFTTIASSSREAFLAVRQMVSGEDQVAHEQWQVAEGLREMGLVSGDNVAFIGDSYRAFWAHLLGVRIAAEVPLENVTSFWKAEPKLKGELINAFARTGVKAIVAEKPSLGTDLNGWQKIRQTDYYVYVLKE